MATTHLRIAIDALLGEPVEGSLWQIYRNTTWPTAMIGADRARIYRPTVLVTR